MSEKSQVGLMNASIHKGQQDFINHTVTKATVNTLLFVAIGGIEGAVSLASGAKSVFNVAKSSQASDWIRTGKTVVSNQIVKGQGTPGATVTWGVKGGGNLAKTGESMGFHFHIRHAITTIRSKSPILKEMEETREIKIVGLFYTLTKGELLLID